MEEQTSNAMMAQKKITVTYTVEEVIKIDEVFDMMLSNLGRDVIEGNADATMLDNALVLNMFLGRLRHGVYNVVMGE